MKLNDFLISCDNSEILEIEYKTKHEIISCSDLIVKGKIFNKQVNTFSVNRFYSLPDGTDTKLFVELKIFKPLRRGWKIEIKRFSNHSKLFERN